MGKRKFLIGTIVLLLIFSFVCGREIPVKSEEHRISLVELFTATWCYYCPAAERLVSSSYKENSDRFVFVEYHINDSLSNKNSMTRARFYGVTGTPTAVINGKFKFIGTDMIKSRGLPRAFYDSEDKPLVTFKEISAGEKENKIYAECTCKTTGIKNPTEFFILLVEDKVKFRSNEYRFVVRDMRSFEEERDSYSERCNFDISTEYKTENLYLLFFVQDKKTGEVYNATLLKLSEAEKNRNIPGVPKFTEISQNTVSSVYITISAETNLDKFELQIAKNKSFESIIAEKIFEGKRTKVENLPPGIYYARVRGVEKSNECTDWSTIRTFFVREVITLQPNHPYMTVNGIKREIDPGRGTKPVIVKSWSRTVVPVRAIVEALGGTIEWNGNERKVTIKFNGNIIELWIDNPKAKVNGQTKWIDENNHNVKPIIINDRTMLPLRFVAESLGCEVSWNSEKRLITLTYVP